MVPEFLQPPVDIVVGLMLADVVDEEGADGTTVVSGGDRTVTFLTSRIPDLSLDSLRIYLNGAGSEFDTDGGLGVQVELVTRETAQKVGLSDTRVSNKHHCCTTIHRRLVEAFEWSETWQERDGFAVSARGSGNFTLEEKLRE